MFQTKFLNVGAMITLESCIHSRNEARDFNTFKIFVVTVNLENRNLYNSSSSLISLFDLCYSLLSGDYYVQHKINMGLKVAFNIKVYGCGNESTKIAPFIRFWEMLQNWAKTERITVFMDTAYEDSSLYLENSSKCFTEKDLQMSESCDCGWWKVFPKKSPLKLSYVIEDKKSSNLFLSKFLNDFTS